MNSQYLNEVIEKFSGFASQNDLQSVVDCKGEFVKDNVKFKIEYSQERKQFTFSYAEKGEETFGEFTELTAWLFDEENHGSKDIDVIAEDFVESASVKLGIIKKSGVKQVALPSKAEAGKTPGIEALTQKFLAVFPVYKEEYVAHVEKYNGFLPIEFFKTTAVPKLKELVDDTKAKKQLTKYFQMLQDMFVDGDREVGNIICSVIIAGAFDGNTEKWVALYDGALKDCQYLRQSGKAAIEEYKRNTKLRAIFNK